MEKDAYIIAGDVGSDGTAVIRFVRKDKAGPFLALDLGEFFYHLRSALDGLVFAAMLQVTGLDPHPHESSFEFPVCRDSPEFKHKTRHLAPLPYKLREWLESIQPYHAAKLLGDDAVLCNLLRLIHDCARKDRHRQFHLVAAPLHELSGQLAFDPPARVLSFEGVPCNLLDDEGEFLRLRLDDFTPATSIYSKGELRISKTVKEIPTVLGLGIDGVLRNAEHAVEVVIREFEGAIAV